MLLDFLLVNGISVCSWNIHLLSEFPFVPKIFVRYGNFFFFPGISIRYRNFRLLLEFPFVTGIFDFPWKIRIVTFPFAIATLHSAQIFGIKWVRQKYEINYPVFLKELQLSICQKLWFFFPFIFYIFATLDISVRWNNLHLKS